MIFWIFFQFSQNLPPAFLCQNIDILTLSDGFWHEIRSETNFKSPLNYRRMNRRVDEKSDFFLCTVTTQSDYFGTRVLEI